MAAWVEPGRYGVVVAFRNDPACGRLSTCDAIVAVHHLNTRTWRGHKRESPMRGPVPVTEVEIVRPSANCERAPHSSMTQKCRGARSPWTSVLSKTALVEEHEGFCHDAGDAELLCSFFADGFVEHSSHRDGVRFWSDRKRSKAKACWAPVELLSSRS